MLFGRRIRALRQMRHLTQESLGERADLSAKFVGMVERGTGNPTLDAVARIAAALQLELWELFRFEETEVQGPALAAARATIAAEKVEEYLVGLPAAEIDRVVRIVEAALDRRDPRPVAPARIRRKRVLR